MRNDLPISPKKKFKYSISFESFDEESLEAGQSDVRGYEIQDDTDAIGDILMLANTTYGIYMPVSFGTWESTEPVENTDFWERGIRKYYALHLTNEDGTEISQEENDFISFLLSDGRYEIDKFSDYAVGGIVLGSVALGIGALITYFYFKGKKGGKGKKQLVRKTSKSVTYKINGKDRKFPINDAWVKEHSLENQSEDYEVPQEDRFEMGGDASEHYHEIEYGEGGVARAKEVIMNKIGLNEENADFITAQSEKFAIWLADSIVKENMALSQLTKQQSVEYMNKNTSILKSLPRRIRNVLDWLQHPLTPKQNLRELGFFEAEQKAKEWHQELQVLGGDIDFTEPEKNIILKTYPKNSEGIEYYWVFIPSNYCNLESSRMGHCGRTGYGNNLISLRSVRPYGKGHTINDSHITIAYGINDGKFYQVKGKKNNKPAEKYFPFIYDLIKSILNDDINKRFIDEKDESLIVIENLLNEQRKIEQEILQHITFNFGGASSTESKFLEGELSFDESTKYLRQDSPIQDNFRIIYKLKEKLNEVRNNRDYEEIQNEIELLKDEAKNFINENIINKFKEVTKISKLIEQAERNVILFNFNGFGKEYGDKEDFGFEDMTNEQLRELYDLKRSIFYDAESIFNLLENKIITEDELKIIDKSNPTILQSFLNQYKLFELGIISEKPSTTFELNKVCEEVYTLVNDGDVDFRIEALLCGTIDELVDNFSYYFANDNELVNNLNKENEEKVINEIVKITGLDKSVVEENGIKYYLLSLDENFEREEFEDISRALANAQNNADSNDYYNYLYDSLKDSLSELGEVHSLNDEGVKMTIDLSNLMSEKVIAEQMDYYDFEDVGDLFEEELHTNNLDLPKFFIDDRYSPYGSAEDFNANFDIYNYEKGGSLRPKNTNKNKIKNMKPSQTKLAHGGSINSTGISKEDYFLVVQNWVYFTFNYPMGFVKDAFGSSRLTNHLQEKFSSAYTRYGSVGVLMSFWANLDNEHREMLSVWIKNNYFNSSSKKTQLQSISDEDYAKIITHWNMFCFNFPYNFIESVFGDNTSHYEEKWVRAYESAGSTGAVNKFFTELSGDNQHIFTDWVYENYDGMKYAKGGSVDKKGKIELSDGEGGRKIAKRIIVETDDAGDVVTYDLEVGLLAGRKKGYFIVQGTWDEVMEEGTEDEYTEEQYFYQEGGLWIEGGKVTDYDGVFELEPKLKPLMSALNLNSSEIFADGGEAKVNNKNEKTMKYANGGNAGDWSASDITNAEYLGIIEFQDNDGEFHNFEVMETDDRLVFGGMTNSGFIESGYIEKDGFSTDETLQSLLEDLEVYYNDGGKYTSQIVFNERMAQGGKVVKKSNKNIRKKRTKKQPKVTRIQFEEGSYEYADGGEASGKWIIEDWAGNHLFQDKVFDSFEDGWDFIYQNIEEETEDDGTYDDYYVVELINNEDEYAGGGKIYSHSEEDGATFIVTQYDNRNVASYKFDSLKQAENQYDRLIDYVKEDISNDEETNTKVIALEGYVAGHGMGWETIRAFDVDEYLESFEDDDKYAGGGRAGAESKSKIKIIENKKEGKKTATQTLVKENNKGEKITYELSAGMHTTPKENRYADGWFEIYATDENDDEYFYSEGGLWIENGRIYDYDGVYELSEKLKPLLSALNLNSEDVFSEGGETGEKYEDEYADGGETGDDLIEYIIPTWAVGYLVNDDFDGLTDEEIQSVDKFVEEVYKEFGNASFMLGSDDDSDSYFSYSNDIDSSGTEVIKLFILPSKNADDNYADGGEAGEEYLVIHTSMNPESFIKKHKLTNYIYEIDENDYQEFNRINFETYPKNQNFLKDESIIEFYYEPIEEYADGGEVEDWMEKALASLIEETGYEDLEITHIVNSKIKYEFIASDGGVEYRVFITEGDAEEIAVEQVRDDLQESPENFNQDWLMNYIDGRDFFEEQLNDMNLSYVEDIESETDSKYPNRLIAELVNNGLMDEDDAESENAEEIADDLKYDYISLLTEGQLDEGMDGLQYFIDNFGENETFGMIVDNNLIDIDEASQDAVNTDGIAHFLSSYDGETLYLSDDCVAYRTN